VPKVKVTIGNDRPPRPALGSTTTAFIVGLAERGPVGEVIEIKSTGQLVTLCGARVAYSPVYDVLDVAFRRGLSRALFSRRVGPAAASATKKLKAGATDVLEAIASSPGEWANDAEIDTEDGVTPETFHVKVTLDGDLLETSPELADNDAAVAWASKFSAFITLKKLAAGIPDEQSVKLAGGADDRNNVDDVVIAKGLELFGADLGTGQVAAPGFTDEATQAAVMAHCEAMQRVPVLDGEDTDDADELIEQVGKLRSLPGARQTAVFAPWDIVPGLALGTTRTVPPCGRQLGAIAAVDAKSGTANVPAAGDEGKDTYPIGLSQTYSDEDRERLNEAGVNISIVEENVVTTFGWRTLADPVTEAGTWLSLASARQVIAMAAEVRSVLKRYLFKPLDAKGIRRAAAEGACQNEVIKPAYQANGVFGDTEAEAAQVVVEQDVSPTDGSIGKLTGNLTARPTPFSEEIDFQVSATSEAL